MLLIFAFRKPQSNFYSIEELFNTISEAIPFEKQKAIAPFYSNGLKNIIKNILFFNQFNSKNNVVHITGDIHYVLLGLWRAKTILTIHDCVSISNLPKTSLKYWFIKLLWYDIPVRLADKITTISEQSKAEIIRYTGIDAERITVIPNFVKDIFQPIEKPKTTETPIILLLGFTPNKNIVKSIEALKGLNVKIVLIGKYEADILNLLEKNKAQYTILNGLTHQEIVEQYQKADIVLFPSLYEGFGMPIIEAQAVGTPVITSNIPPMNAIAADAALLINPQNVDEIREKVIELMNSSQLKENLIEKGYKNVEKYRFSNILLQYISLYSLCAE